MAVHKKTRKRDGATVYFAVYLGPNGSRVKEKCVVVPADAADRAHERGQTKARALADERRLEVENGTWTPPKSAKPGIRLHSLFKRFLEEYRGRNGKEPGDYYAQKVELWKKHFPNKRANLVTVQEVEAFRNARAKQPGRTGELLSDGTIRKDLVALSTVFQWAVDRCLISGNPASPALVRRPPEPRNRTRYLSDKEERKLLNASEPWLQRVIRFAISTGMDRQEILDLQWSSIDDATRVIYAPRAKTGVPRILPINATIQAILDETKRAKKTRSIDRDDRVFLGPDGRALSADSVKCALFRAYRKAKLSVPGPFKVFRHTFASRLAMQGTALNAIAKLLGHSTPYITERYAHLSKDYLRAEMEALDRPERHAEDEQSNADSRP